MWYERTWVMYVVNVTLLTLMFLLLFSVYGFTNWQPYVIILLTTIISVYNSLVSYNSAIDKTVDSLAKHYEKQLMIEIDKAVKKAMGM